MANRLLLNTALDQWARLCIVDANSDGGSEYPPLDGFFGANIGFIGPRGASTEPVTEIQKLTTHRGGWQGYGGPGAVVSLGADGFMVVSTNKGDTDADDTVGVLKLGPEGSMHFREHRNTTPWNWFDPPVPDGGYSYLDRRVGLANAANFGLGGENADEVLVGWSERIQFQGVADHYVVARADRNGNLLGDPVSLQGGVGSATSEPTGWGEDSNWANVPATGCVVMPHTCSIIA